MERISCFMDLAKKEVESFQNNNLVWMECLVTCDCTKSIMEIAYRTLVRERKIKAIEEMDHASKENIWSTAKEFSKDRLDTEGLIKMAKSLIALEYLLQ